MLRFFSVRIRCLRTPCWIRAGRFVRAPVRTGGFVPAFSLLSGSFFRRLLLAVLRLVPSSSYFSAVLTFLAKGFVGFLLLASVEFRIL